MKLKDYNQYFFNVIIILLIFEVSEAFAVVQPNLLNSQIVGSGDISEFKVSSDGNYVVYRGDQDLTGKFELYSTLLLGGTPKKLNKAMGLGSNVHSFQISQDSQRVIYIADQDSNDVFEIFSVPIGGGPSIQLNPEFSDNRKDVSLLSGSFLISPDSTRVVYLADQETLFKDELFSVPILGGTPVKLNPTLVSLGRIEPTDGFLISPDSSRVIYLATQENKDSTELFSVPLSGGISVKLNGNLAADGNVEQNFGFRISPDSERVVYEAEQDSTGVKELYTVSISGGNSTKVNSALASGTNLAAFLISPNSEYIVYQARLTGSSIYNFYSAPISGGVSTVLNSNVVIGGGSSTGGSIGYDEPFLISADSARVVYRAAHDTPGVLELYSASIVGGNVIKLNGDLTSGGNVSPYVISDNHYFRGFQISPDGNRVLYFADQEVDAVLNLYSVPIGGGEAIQVNSENFGSGIPPGFWVSGDSKSVIYAADQNLDNVLELYAAPIDDQSNITNKFLNRISTVTISFFQHLRLSLTWNTSTLVFLNDTVEDPWKFQLFSIRNVFDSDDDGVFDPVDNCVDEPNSEQVDTDANGEGDVCDEAELCIPIKTLSGSIALICL